MPIAQFSIVFNGPRLISLPRFRPAAPPEDPVSQGRGRPANLGDPQRAFVHDAMFGSACLSFSIIGFLPCMLGGKQPEYRYVDMLICLLWHGSGPAQVGGQMVFGAANARCVRDNQTLWSQCWGVTRNRWLFGSLRSSWQDILPIEKEYRMYKTIKEDLQKARAVQRRSFVPVVS